MSQKTVKIHDGRDVTKILSRAECQIRNGNGSHRVATLPDGTKFTYYEHGDFPPGMLHMVVKTLVKAGLLVAVLSALCWLSYAVAYASTYGWDRVLQP